jgi:hypothetical protein
MTSQRASTVDSSMSLSWRAAKAAPPTGASLAWVLVTVGLACFVLTAPALWNRYPLLQYDTGGYLARWYEGYLVPSRSTVFGLFLHIGEGLHFWPEVLIQSALAVWIVGLVLRVHGLFRPVQLLAVIAGLGVVTALPWLTSILLTDIFTGLSVLALHLLLFHAFALERWEKAALLVLIAFAAATHNATLGTLLAMLAVATMAACWTVPGLIRLRCILSGAAAVAAGALMLLSANYALSGQFAWTPGGYGISFGRMLQDGIVARFLREHCPSPRYKLCPFRNELPNTADEFLWGYGVFNDLGRFAGLDGEMREIVLRTLAEYPLQQIDTALTATARQLVMVATGAGVHDQLPHTYGIIQQFVPGEVTAMRDARQQRGELDFDRVNLLHVPVGLGATFLMPILVLTCLRRDRRDPVGLLAASVGVALFANASICAVVSGPHDRYGARMAWVAVVVVALACIRLAKQFRETPAALSGGTV